MVFKSQRDLKTLALSRMQSKDKESFVTSKSNKSRKSAFTTMRANTTDALPILKEEANIKDKKVEEL